MQDPMAATISLLKADADVRLLAADRIWGDKMPKAEASSPARPNVVVRHGPGRGGPGGYIDLQETTFDLFCYGETPAQAKALHLECYRTLKRARRQVIEETLIHSFDQIGGPRALNDPDIQWDFILSSWKSLAAEEQAT